MYDPYSFVMKLRKNAPGFSRIGAPTKLKSTTSFQNMKDRKFVLVKTKDEIVEEHANVMEVVYKRIITSLLVAAIGIYLLFMFLSSGSEFYLLATIFAVSYAMYKWWHGGAAYSNYQQFEMRPILVPIEDLREPSIIPHWLTGKPPTFKPMEQKASPPSGP